MISKALLDEVAREMCEKSVHPHISEVSGRACDHCRAAARFTLELVARAHVQISESYEQEIATAKQQGRDELQNELDKKTTGFEREIIRKKIANTTGPKSVTAPVWERMPAPRSASTWRVSADAQPSDVWNRYIDELQRRHERGR